MQLSKKPTHILLVEQNIEICTLFTAVFTSQGHTVSVAREPLEAFEKAQTKPPGAIFSSIVFDEMDGFELCRQLRRMPEVSDILIVALTGYSENGIEAKVRDAGFDKYLLKPVSIHVLLSLLDTR